MYYYWYMYIITGYITNYYIITAVNTFILNVFKLLLVHECKVMHCCKITTEQQNLITKILIISF